MGSNPRNGPCVQRGGEMTSPTGTSRRRACRGREGAKRTTRWNTWGYDTYSPTHMAHPTLRTIDALSPGRTQIVRQARGIGNSAQFPSRVARQMFFFVLVLFFIYNKGWGGLTVAKMSEIKLRENHAYLGNLAIPGLGAWTPFPPLPSLSTVQPNPNTTHTWPFLFSRLPPTGPLPPPHIWVLVRMGSGQGPHLSGWLVKTPQTNKQRHHFHCGSPLRTAFFSGD